MLLPFKNMPCSPMDITVKHLSRKLKKLDKRIQKDSARPQDYVCLLYTSPSPRDGLLSRMPSSA